MGALIVAAPVIFKLIQAGVVGFSAIKDSIDARRLRVQDESGTDLTIEQLKTHYDAFVAAADKAGDNAAHRIEGR